MTIDKSQGLDIDCVVIYVSEKIGKDHLMIVFLLKSNNIFF